MSGDSQSMLASCEEQSIPANNKSARSSQPIANSKRKSRNENEKRRRDTFNRLISDLTVLVAGGNQKMDKSNVLKCAINFLKDHQLRAESTSDESACPLDANIKRLTECTLSDVVQLYLELLYAGVFCISCFGHIQHASTRFARHLKYATANDLCGTNLYDHLDTHSAKLLHETLSSAMLQQYAAMTANCSASKPLVSSNDSSIDHLIVQTASSTTKHSLVLSGYLRWTPTTSSPSSSTTLTDTADRSSDDRQTEADTYEKSKEPRFVGVAIPKSMPTNNADITLHALGLTLQSSAKFTIIYNLTFVCVELNGQYADLLGYNQTEMLGISGYNYVHTDDLHNLSQSHQQLLKQGSGQMCAHRLLTKSRQWLWVECFAVLETCSTTDSDNNCNDNSKITRVYCHYKITNEVLHDLEPPTSCTETPSKLFSRSLSNESLTFMPDGFVAASTPRPQSQQKVSKSLALGSEKNNNDNNSTTKTLSISLPSASSVDLSGQTWNTILPPPKSSCSARIIIEPLPPKRLKTTANTAGDVSIYVSMEYARSPCASTELSPFATLSPSISDISSPKRQSQSSLATIKHYRLPDHKPSDSNTTTTADNNKTATCDKNYELIGAKQTPQHSPTAVTNCIPNQSSQTPEPTLSISPMYRQVWVELQRQTELLRQQVIQKEMELRELHLQKCLSSIDGRSNEESD